MDLRCTPAAYVPPTPPAATIAPEAQERVLHEALISLACAQQTWEANDGPEHASHRPTRSSDSFCSASGEGLTSSHVCADDLAYLLGGSALQQSVALRLSSQPRGGFIYATGHAIFATVAGVSEAG
ncbi:hypothetical protein NDU88_002741 [Pleurodeles waltl]|uniref:Uncharacterized protein n=1 Tax=Pleurodeles waltl TaxID=8319 RepID=A0AAV7QAR6_PLEWA|nr:hypothetical protein NDU88_002741 [Pleurodeles waltl]